jgi:hypothetical protein
MFNMRDREEAFQAQEQELQSSQFQPERQLKIEPANPPAVAGSAGPSG